MYPEFDPMCQEGDGGDAEECACLLTWPDGIPPGHGDMRCALGLVAGNHKPVLVHAADDPERVGTPAEVCDTCSDFTAGRLVPASFCHCANAQLEPAPWE